MEARQGWSGKTRQEHLTQKGVITSLKSYDLAEVHLVVKVL